jgi:hypothetical protein
VYRTAVGACDALRRWRGEERVRQAQQARLSQAQPDALAGQQRRLQRQQRQRRASAQRLAGSGGGGSGRGVGGNLQPALSIRRRRKPARAASRKRASD